MLISYSFLFSAKKNFLLDFLCNPRYSSLFFFPFFLSFKSNEVKSSCCQEKENKENMDGNIILDGNNKLGLEGEEDEEEEEEEDRINNEYVLYDEEHSSDGEFEEDAEGGNDSSRTYRNT